MGSISEPEVTLFVIKYSGFAQRVRISLEEKGISYKSIEVDPRNKPQELLDANPIHKKIPTLIHNGKSVAESLVILEYLEEEWPERVQLMPTNAFDRAQVRFWADFIYKTSEKVVASYKSEAGSPERQAAEEGAVNNLKTLEAAMTKYSAEGPFFTGEKFGLLDVVMAPLDNALLVAKTLATLVVPGPDELPRFYKWTDTIRAKPSVSTVMPTEDETISFFRILMANNFFQVLPTK